MDLWLLQIQSKGKLSVKTILQSKKWCFKKHFCFSTHLKYGWLGDMVICSTSLVMSSSEKASFRLSDSRITFGKSQLCMSFALNLSRVAFIYVRISLSQYEITRVLKFTLFVTLLLQKSKSTGSSGSCVLILQTVTTPPSSRNRVRG